MCKVNSTSYLDNAYPASADILHDLIMDFAINCKLEMLINLDAEIEFISSLKRIYFIEIKV
jgi:hypothetical protein